MIPCPIVEECFLAGFVKIQRYVVVLDVTLLVIVKYTYFFIRNTLLDIS